MIKEVFQSKVINQLDSIVKEINKYLGEEYKNKIYEKAGKINVFLARGKGVVKVGNEERYIEDEPICVKDDEYSYVVVPVDLLGQKAGNVMFLHVYLHALCSDIIENDCSGLNEVIIDYMANDIAKLLENKNINITLDNNPSYESNSFYSNFYDMIEKFFLNNKKAIFEVLINDKENNISGISEISNAIEDSINNFIYNEDSAIVEVKSKPKR